MIVYVLGVILRYVHNVGFLYRFLGMGIGFREGKGIHMKNRRYVSLVVVFCYDVGNWYNRDGKRRGN